MPRRQDTAGKDAAPPTISTERLVLTLFDPLTPSDYNEFIKVSNSPYTVSRNGDLGMHTREDVDAKCKAFALSRTPESDLSKATTTTFPTHPILLIRTRASDEVIEVITLFQRRPFPFPDLGYAIHEPCMGQGYATEAAKGGLKFWRDDLGVENIWAGAFVENTASHRVAEKIGFVHGGTFSVKLPDGHERHAYAFILPGGEPFPDGIVIDAKPATSQSQ